MERIRIGITQGDINGIGAEVIAKVLANPDILDLFTPVIFGNAEVFRNAVMTLKSHSVSDAESQNHADYKEDTFRFDIVNDISEIKDGRINLLEVSAQSPVQIPGVASKDAGKAAVEALEAASNAIENGDIDLLVTAPIDKNSVQGEGFSFPGHTEYLENRFPVGDSKALMILAHGKLRVALVTTHMPLAEVATGITKERVVDAIINFNNALKMDFGCERPKIAVLSLNPHCGDGGVLGTEETEKIIPAIEECRAKGIMAFGPIAADGLFGSGTYSNFDGVLAMYHDQGLAPFKALASGGGVNFTAGINIIRTSPAHGTAYDIAGKGVADETSMRDAIYAAIDIARHRDRFLEASENPLPLREISNKKNQREKNVDLTLEDTDNQTEDGRD